MLSMPLQLLYEKRPSATPSLPLRPVQSLPAGPSPDERYVLTEAILQRLG